jgi:hypothetical protein
MNFCQHLNAPKQIVVAFPYRIYKFYLQINSLVIKLYFEEAVVYSWNIKTLVKILTFPMIAESVDFQCSIQ